MSAPDPDDPGSPRTAEFLLTVEVNDDGTIDIGLRNVEPAHVGRLLVPNLAAAVEHAMFVTAAGPVERDDPSENQ